MEKLRDWMIHHQRLLFMGLGFFLLVFVLAGAGFFWKQKREEKAFLALEKAGENSSELEKVVKNFGRTKSAWLALWQGGAVYLKEGNHEKALSAFEQCYQKSRVPVVRVAALHGMARAEEAAKHFKEAAAIYQRAADERGNLIAGQSLFLAGHLQELGGDLVSAQNIYETLAKKENLDPGLKEKVLERQLWLAIQK